MGNLTPETASSDISSLIVRPHHVAVSVKDFDAALDFFVGFVGMKVLGEMDHRREENLDRVVGLTNVEIRWAMLEREGFHIELFTYYQPVGEQRSIRQCDRGLTHLCFEVYDVDRVYKKVIAEGYRTNAPPLEMRGGRSKAIYVDGPEGIVVEFLELRPWK